MNVRALAPKKSLRGYLAQYAEEHKHPGTKITHMIGIPMIAASIPTAFVSVPVATGLFTGGWALQLVGHFAFEKNKPSFVKDPYYLAVGVVWAGVEWAQLARLPIPEALLPEAKPAPASHEPVDVTVSEVHATA